MYRKPTPENRTIVQGIWSDLLDLVLTAIKDGGGDDVALKVEIQNKVESIAAEMMDSRSTARNLELIYQELRLLNARFEELHETDINHEDLD